MLMPAVFGQAGMEHMRKYGTTQAQFAKVAVKNHKHSTRNPLSQYQVETPLEQVLGARVVAYPNTLYMCCPTGDGAAAAVRRVGGQGAPARRDGAGAGLGADVRSVDASAISTLPDVNTLHAPAPRSIAYERAGVGPDDLDLVELHDCFATAELLHYENLGLCGDGEAGRMIDEGETALRRTHPGERLGRPAVEGPSARRHRRRQHLRGDAASARARRAPARSRARRSVWRTSSVSARRARSTCWAPESPDPRAASRDAVAVELAVQRASREAEQPRGGDALAARRVERAQDLVALGRFQRERGRRAERRGPGAANLAGRCSGRITLPDAATMARSITLRQLAHVARPGVTAEQREHRRADAGHVAAELVIAAG